MLWYKKVRLVWVCNWSFASFPFSRVSAGACHSRCRSAACLLRVCTHLLSPAPSYAQTAHASYSAVTHRRCFVLCSFFPLIVILLVRNFVTSWTWLKLACSRSFHRIFMPLVALLSIYSLKQMCYFSSGAFLPHLFVSNIRPAEIWRWLFFRSCPLRCYISL